jgi:hypothetical protein
MLEARGQSLKILTKTQLLVDDDNLQFHTIQFKNFPWNIMLSKNVQIGQHEKTMESFF